MAILSNLKEQFRFADKKTFYQYLLIFFGITFIIFGAIAYYYFSRSARLTKQIKILNTQRLEAQEILTRYAIVQKQRELVENLLTQDKTFFIGQYFSDLIKKQNIPEDMVQQQEPITEEVNADYNQVKLGGSISGIDMRQLTELLNAIEQEDRISIEDLQIQKDSKNKKIDVNLVIATLEPKQEQTE